MRPAPAAIRNAATVVLLRAGAAGLETFLLKRHPAAVFGPGAYVFPGGAVDAGDGQPAMLARCDGLDDETASSRLGLAGGGLAFWVSAVRECFEEAGLLLATDARGAEWAAGRDLAAQRARINAGQCSFATLCAEQQLRLPVCRLLYFDHWITPAGAPRRFSTRFYACRAPPGHQTANPDGEETVAGEWLTPAAALARQRRGDLTMMAPTMAQLRLLAGSDSVAAALDTLARRKAGQHRD